VSRIEDDNIVRVACATIPTAHGDFELCLHRAAPSGEEHMTLRMGDLGDGSDVLARVHSECFTGEVLGSRRCDCADQLERAMQAVAAEGRGVIVYLRQEGRGIGLEDKLRAYALQDEGMDTVDANLALGHAADERDYAVAGAILRSLGVGSVRLLTNNPDKVAGLERSGIRVVERLPLVGAVTPQNAAYLRAKAARLGHALRVEDRAEGEGREEGG
jgi:GTP cyclohydrolase II